MTRTDFDQWISQHYGELTAVARRLVDNPEDAVEVVHAAVAQVLDEQTISCVVETPSGLAYREGTRCRLDEVTHPWSWMVNAIRGTAKDRRISNQRKAAKNLPPSIKFGKGDKPGGTPDQIRKHIRKLTPEQDSERWLQRRYLRNLERDRRNCDMDGYGRKQTLVGSNGHPDDNGDAVGSLDPPFKVRFPYEEENA